MLPKTLRPVTGAQGGGHERSGLKVHAPLVSADERWEGHEKYQLVQ